MGLTVAFVALETEEQLQTEATPEWFRLLKQEVMASVCNGKLTPHLNF